MLLATAAALGVSRKAGAPPAPTAPANVVLPVLSGTPQVGQSLGVDDGSWTGYPAPAFAYQWRNNGADIGGANASTYTLLAADYADSISCRVTATNSQGSASATSGAVVIAGTVPVISGAPTVSGTGAVGQTLTVTPAGVTGIPSPARTYQWLRDGAEIAGANGTTYVLVSVDASTAVSCRQIETNAAGSDSEVSNAIAVSAGGGGGDLLSLDAGTLSLDGDNLTLE